MSFFPEQLPSDPALLKQLIFQQHAELQSKREELQSKREELQSKREELQLKTIEISGLKHEVAHLKELARLCRHRSFGPSSERHLHPNQPGLFNEAEDLARTFPDSPKPNTSGSKQQPKRSPINPNIPRQTQQHDLSAEEQICCGESMSFLGTTDSEQVDIIPARVIVKKHFRCKYVCRSCRSIKTAEMPKQPIPKSLAAPGLLAAIAVNKYADGLPLYRQESILRRAGIELKRATTAQWMIKLGQLLQPLFNLMQDDLLERSIIQADETTLQVLKEKGRKAKQKSYVWVTASGRHSADPPIVLFHYGPSRSGAVAQRLLSGWSGYLMTDGYEGYSPVARRQGISSCACFDHVRRRFKDAINARKEGEPEGLAEDALWYLYQLYEVERRERDHSGDRRKIARSLYTQSIMQHLRRWLDRHLDRVRPSSPTGIALNYLHNQWPKLIRILESGEVPISNELCENAIRPFVVGRKAWLFSASAKGADSSCTIYSLIETAKANGHEPYAYFRHIIENLPACESVEDFADLLPYRLRPEQIHDIAGDA